MERKNNLLKKKERKRKFYLKKEKRKGKPYCKRRREKRKTLLKKKGRKKNLLKMTERQTQPTEKEGETNTTYWKSRREKTIEKRRRER